MGDLGTRTKPTCTVLRLLKDPTLPTWDSWKCLRTKWGLVHRALRVLQVCWDVVGGVGGVDAGHVGAGHVDGVTVDTVTILLSPSLLSPSNCHRCPATVTATIILVVIPLGGITNIRRRVV